MARELKILITGDSTSATGKAWRTAWRHRFVRAFTKNPIQFVAEIDGVQVSRALVPMIPGVVKEYGLA